MRFEILTLFPKVFRSPLEESILARAIRAGIITVCVHNLRDFATGRHRVVDDYPYGGGAGMIIKPEPIVYGVEYLKSHWPDAKAILMSPQGRLFNHQLAKKLADEGRNLIIVCGHYEGVDHRAIELSVDDEISVGDYILTGGEPAALILIDAVSRLIKGVLGKDPLESYESFNDGLLEYPQYTRPQNFRGLRVPEILTSGDHAKIREWRKKAALATTQQKRPDLLRRSE